jgi:hypothetical protein
MLNKKLITVSLISIFIYSCANMPPLQEMSNARQTISAAKELSASAKDDQRILEAERLLSRAERLIEVSLYDKARQDALRAQKEAIEYLEAEIAKKPK